MRKYLLLFLPVLLVGIASFTIVGKQAPKKSTTQSVKPFDPRDWIIEKDVAMRMLKDYRDNCHGNGRCYHSQRHVPHHTDEITQYLEQDYTIIGSQTLMGLYNVADADRYRKTRNIKPGDPRGNVGGWSTVIVEYHVRPKKTGALLPVEMYIYADNYTICPPPEDPPCSEESM